MRERDCCIAKACYADVQRELWRQIDERALQAGVDDTWHVPCATVEAAAGHRYDYAHLLPGIRKAVRAAGTVIRTTSDSVNIHLIDDRFARPQVQRLLPKRWRIGNFPSGVNSATP